MAASDEVLTKAAMKRASVVETLSQQPMTMAELMAAVPDIHGASITAYVADMVKNKVLSKGKGLRPIYSVVGGESTPAKAKGSNAPVKSRELKMYVSKRGNRIGFELGGMRINIEIVD